MRVYEMSTNGFVEMGSSNCSERLFAMVLRDLTISVVQLVSQIEGLFSRDFA